jgi:multiple antibiotic resistance protein
MGFFAIMNPVANTPVFPGLTASDSNAIRRRIAFKALMITFILIVAFILLGKLIFSLFGITLPAFQITGGILVFMIGLQMLHGQLGPGLQYRCKQAHDAGGEPLGL